METTSETTMMSETTMASETAATTGLSRRAFFTGAAGLGAVAALGALAGCAPAAPEALSETGTDEAAGEGPRTYDVVDATYDTDLVIVGGGGSGLACAVQAALNGTSFILIEKGSELGGNASFVEGMFAIQSAMAADQGISVTPSEIIEAELERGQYRQNGALWMDLCAKSAENIEWCLDQGVMYSGLIDNYNGGLYPTFHWFKDGKCRIGYVEPMVKRVEELGVEVHLDTAATALIMEDGAVVGLYAEGPDGVAQYNCKAVVFATGGFGGNPDYIEQQGWNVDNLFVVGSSNAAGDGYRMAREVGAADFMVDSAQSILYNIPALPPIDFHNDALNPVNGYFGIVADKERRVLDGQSQPIAGLYAIGNDGNMLYRHVYTINMPGTAFGNQVNSGREAANSVAAFLAS